MNVIEIIELTWMTIITSAVGVEYLVKNLTGQPLQIKKISKNVSVVGPAGPQPTPQQMAQSQTVVVSNVGVDKMSKLVSTQFPPNK